MWGDLYAGCMTGRCKMRRDVSERVLVCDPSPQAQRALTGDP